MEKNVLGPLLPPAGHDFVGSQSSSRSSFRCSAAVAAAPPAHRLEVEERPRRDFATNDADCHNDAEPEVNPETQESHTQHEMTQGNELTQLGMDDDDDDDGEGGCDEVGATQSQDFPSPPPVDPLTVPWGRLMPVGGSDGGGDGRGGTAGGFQDRPGSARGATEMLPRPPSRAGSVAGGTRGRSPSIGSERGGGGGRTSRTPSPPPARATFLGLTGLATGDRFNEYVLGRSAKADVTAQKMDPPAPPLPAEGAAEEDDQTRQRREARRRRHDYVHAMVSNRHCRIYCLLADAGGGGGGGGGGGLHDVGPPEMEVFVEDASGNGTLVNGTALLRKNERRKLHTGDVICLLNPKMLAKRMRGATDRKAYAAQYSYVFVNLYEQEARHGWGAAEDAGSGCGRGSAGSRRRGRSGGGNGGGRKAGDEVSPPPSASSSRVRRPGAVDPRATRCHSANDGKGRRSLFAATTGKGAAPRRRDARRGTNDGGGDDPGDLAFVRRVEDDYDLRDLLGTGTCGEVRRAIHRRTGEERAVKVIPLGGRAGHRVRQDLTAERLAAIRAEAEILRSLDHPYVVTLHDTYVAPGRAIYLVMELVRGGDLFDRIVARGRYDETAARRLFRRALAAVHYLHEERGIVHRDLKPENMLLVDRRSDVDVKLTDFGLAKAMAPEGLKTFCGTPQYFAPEVLRRRHDAARGDGRYGKGIDCWSLGVVLFVLLSGSPPFDASEGLDAVAEYAEVRFPEGQWKDVSGEARDLVARLLERDPDRRTTVGEACRHGWVLTEDGDTHRHPLDDPKLGGRGGGGVAREKRAAEEKAGEETAAEIGGESRAGDGAPPGSLSDATLDPASAVENRGENVEEASETSDRRRAPPSVPPEALPSCPARKVRAPPDGPLSRGERKDQKARKPDEAVRTGNERPATAAVPSARQVCALPDRPPSPGDGTVRDGRELEEAAKLGNDGRATEAAPSFLPWRKACAPGKADVAPGRKDSNEEKSQMKSLSAPRPNDESERRPSVWPAGRHDRTVTKAIAQSCHATRPSPNGSPVRKRQLFDREEPPAPRKVTKRDVASIRAAGRTLPKPTLRDDSRAEERKPATTAKKVQSTLFSSGKGGRPTGPPGAQQRRGKGREGGGERERGTTVTPPGGDESNGGAPAFRLSERHQLGGQRASPEDGDGVGAAEVPPDDKSKPLDDELQSDFSDDDEPVADVPTESKKRPLDQFLRKRKMESIESSATVDDAGGRDRDRKKLVQTYLFGRPPPGGPPEDASPASAAEKDPSPTNRIRASEGADELRRRSTGESLGGGTAAAVAPPGKQRTIQSWFRPKK